MSAKCMCRLFDAVLEDLCKIVIAEFAILSPLQTSKCPLFGRRLRKLVAEHHVDFGHHLWSHVVNVLELGNGLADDVFHPLVVSRTEGGVPVVEYGELCGYYAAGTALQALATGLDFGAKVEPPF